MQDILKKKDYHGNHYNSVDHPSSHHEELQVLPRLYLEERIQLQRDRLHLLLHHAGDQHLVFMGSQEEEIISGAKLGGDHSNVAAAVLSIVGGSAMHIQRRNRRYSLAAKSRIRYYWIWNTSLFIYDRLWILGGVEECKIKY